MAVPFLSHWMRLTHDSSQLTHFQLDHWYSRPSKELFIWLSANSNISSISSIYSTILQNVYIWFNRCIHMIQLVSSPSECRDHIELALFTDIYYLSCMHTFFLKIMFLHKLMEKSSIMMVNCKTDSTKNILLSSICLTGAAHLWHFQHRMH